MAMAVSFTIITTLLLMLQCSTVSAAALVSKDQTSCTMCNECPNPCPVPSLPPPPPPPSPPPPVPSPPPPALPECPPPPALPECPPPPALPECPPPPAPVPPCQDICSHSPPDADLPAVPNRPPLPPFTPSNPGPGIFPPNVNPVYYYTPPHPDFSNSVRLRMHHSISTVSSIFVLFFTCLCFFF